MGLWDIFKRSSGSNSYLPQGMIVNGGLDQSMISSIMGMSVDQLFRSQPYLRTVVTFLARNIAQLGLQTFERVDDQDRRRVRDNTVALLLKRPNAHLTTYKLIEGLVGDLALYDNAYWMITESADTPSGWQIQPVPPAWVKRSGGGSVFSPEWFEVHNPQGRSVRIPAEQMMHFHGWDPTRPSEGSTPVEALKQILLEQMHSQAYRQQIWQRGGRVGTVISRPKDAPEWSSEARSRFSRDWKEKWTGDDGPKAGGTPILEDGMELKRIGFSAHEDQFVESAKLSLQVVASVYHVNPTMIGLLDNANFSNVREFRRMLYGDTLGPIIAMIEDQLNTFLLPRVGAEDGVYVEFNIMEKLQGSFEEQTQALQSATGRPWMTANEARAKLNMPALEGDANQIVTPLNVLVGNQASPNDSGSQNRRGTLRSAAKSATAIRIKNRADENQEQKVNEVLTRYFKRQRISVLSALGAKNDADWWDEARWDRELSDDLFALAMQVTKQVSAEVLAELGFDPDEYDAARTEKFLRAVADSRAGMINATTRQQITDALAANPDDYEEGEAPTPAHVFDIAESSRAGITAATLVTTYSAFATVEASKQVAGDRASKTWVVTSADPRADHAAMDGETVGIEDVFSNGANWPGDPVLGADGVAGCMCAVDILIP